MAPLKIVLLDDDLAIREIIRTYLSELEDKSKLNLQFYSSSNGIEGLGYVYVANPDILLIDTTLPKYSGKEVVDFLLTNSRFKNNGHQTNTKVVVLTESSDTKLKNLPSNYTVLDKSDKEFTGKLKELIAKKAGKSISKDTGTKEKLVNRAINLANRADRIIRRIDRSNVLLKILLYFPWLAFQLILSIYLLGTKLTTRRVKDDNIQQEKQDLMAYRVKYYPTLVTFMTGVLILLIQLILFVGGGVVIFNTRVESIFALGVDEKGYEFNIEQATNYEYDDTKIAIGDGGVMLKGTETEIPDPEEESTIPEEPPVEEETPPTEDPVEEPEVPEETPIEEEEPPVEEPVSPEEEVLGASTEPVTPATTITTYPTDNPSIVVKEGVGYTSLEKIIERSNINGDETSIQTPEEYNALLDTLEPNDIRKQAKITYQLSPDKESWYYLNTDINIWEEIIEGYEKSNTIQEINKGLGNYQEVTGIGKLYLKIFLHTDDPTQSPTLEEIVVTKETILFTPIKPEGIITIAVDPGLDAYYIDGVSGLDSNAGTSGAPLKTIQAAADVADAGDNIYVKGGITYTDTEDCGGGIIAVVCINTNSGSAGNKIVFQSWPGTGIPVIELGTNANGIYIGQDYITFDGFKVLINGSSGVQRGINAMLCQNVLISNNILLLGGASITIGIQVQTTSNSTVSNNTTYQLFAGIAAYGATTTGLSLKNNVVTGSTAAITTDGPTTPFDNDYNLLYDNVADFDNGNVAGPNSITGQDPLFVNAAGGDFTLQNTSPAINAGADLSGTVDADILGYSRPRGGDYDIGAYEDLNIYIAGDTGNDATGDGSASNPWQTIQKGADNAIAGDTIYVKGGVTYSGTSSCWVFSSVVCFDTTSGTSGNPITLQAWPGTGIPTIDATSDNGVTTYDVSYINIEGLKIINGGSSILGAVVAYDSNYINLLNNIVVDSGKGANFQGTDNVKIYNNTFYNNSSAAVTIGNTAITSVEIKNNIASECSFACYLSESSGNTGAILADNNLYFNSTWPSLEFNQMTDGGNNISEQDPLFVNAGGGDFSLESTSPAIDAGDDSVLGVVPTDISGAVRPQGAGIDIGAYEDDAPLADADPVLQGDGSYIITVDSTTDEDNVSSTGYDDGGGAYSGGGTEGPDGTADGETSLREAIEVADNHAGLEYIHFDIPEDNTDHKCYQDDGVSGQTTLGNKVATTVKDDPSCGGTQIDPDHPYSWFELTNSGAYSINSQVIIDGYTQDGSHKNTAAMGETLNSVIKIDLGDGNPYLYGGDSEISGIIISDNDAMIRIYSSNNHVHGIYMGVDPSGLNALGRYNNISLFTGANNNVIGSDLDENNDNAEINILNDAGEINHTPYSANVVIRNPQVNNLKVARNYFNTGRTGKETGGYFWGGIGVYFRFTTPSVMTENTEIRDNVFANTSHGIFIEQDNCAYDVENILIDGNRFGTDWSGEEVLNYMRNPTNSTHSHVYMYAASSCTETIFGGKITNNIFKNFDWQEGASHNAISLYHVKDGLEISGNHIENMAGVGIRLRNSGSYASENILIEDNTVDYTEQAIVLDTIESSTIRNNDFNDACSNNQYLEVYGDNPIFVEYFNKILVGVRLDEASNNNIIENNTLTSSGNYSDYCRKQVGINADSSSGNTVRNNIIEGDFKSGIYLSGGTEDANFVTENDSGDVDTGANDLQNYPEIEKVTYLSGGKYRISGVLDGKNTEAPWEVEICESDNHSSGHGGCIQTLGFVTVKNNEDGPDHWQTTVTIEGDDGTQERVFTSLATNSNGSTSEFSENKGYTLATYPITLTYPTEGEEITNRTPLLDWNDNGDLDLDHWEVYLNHETSNNLVKIGEIEKERTNFQISSELSLDYTDWYWKVVGVRENGTTGGESIVESFKVVKDAEPLTLLYPTGDVSIDELRPTLQWTKTDVEDAEYYKIYLREVIEGETTPLVSEENLLATIDDISIEEYKLLPRQKLDYLDYEWIVVAYYANGEVADRSDIERFSVVKEAGLPVTGESQDDFQEEDSAVGQMKIWQWFCLSCLCIVLIGGGIVVYKVIILRREEDEEEDQSKS